MAHRMRKTEIAKARELIENARLAGTMEGAMFHRPVDPPYGPAVRVFTSEIKAATEEYREGWIVDPLSRALAIIDAELGGEGTPDAE